MNQHQVARQLAYLLRSRTWGGSGSAVFGRVIVSDMDIQDLVMDSRLPLAIVRPGAVENDPSFPEICAFDFEVEVAVRGYNDARQESAVIGGTRTSFTESGGRGLLEVAAEALATIQRNDSETGIAVLSRAQGGGRSVFVDGDYMSTKTIEVRTRGGTQRYEHPCRAFSNSGGTLSWTLPPARYDRLKVVLRYAAGATAPTSVTGGTGATLASDLATSFTHAAGAGQFSYALFAQYDENGDGAADFTSASVTLTATF